MHEFRDDFDYTKWRKTFFGDASVADINAAAVKYTRSQGILGSDNSALPSDTIEAFKQVGNGEYETFSNSEELFKSIE